MEPKKFRLPNWAIFGFGICDLIVSIVMVCLIIFGDYQGLTFGDLWRPGLFILILLLLNYLFFRVFLSFVTISNEGITSTSPATSTKFVGWDEIREVKRPLLRIPSEYTYVISESGDRLTLFRSYPGYRDIIKLIKERSPRLEKCNS